MWSPAGSKYSPERGARPAGGGGPRGAHLVATSLTLGYGEPPETQPVVDNVNLALKPGERMALVGASGSGKTTLLHALAGLMEPLGGKVTVDGETVASPGSTCTQHAAYMFQRDLLLPWKTARENAVLAATVARRPSHGSDPVPRKTQGRGQADALLREFGLGDVLDAYPHQLSGGMRQRVALARTLLLGRGLVLLDEPFAGLDSLTRGDLQVWMQGVMNRHLASWVLVTHDIHEAALLADRVAVLGGRPAGIVGWVETSVGLHVAVTRLQRLLTSARDAED
jgi:ABC-type nitrate/sulfonate/bicarbonate transport system ATPase subunit